MKLTVASSILSISRSTDLFLFVARPLAMKGCISHGHQLVDYHVPTEVIQRELDVDLQVASDSPRMVVYPELISPTQLLG